MEPLATRASHGDAARGARARRDFGKSRRLRTASDFNRVFKLGRRQQALELTLAFRVRPFKEGRAPLPRLGLSVSRKVGGSVERNLLKRRLREIFRLNQERLAPGSEWVVIPRKESGKLSYFELEQRVLTLMERSKLMKREEK